MIRRYSTRVLNMARAALYVHGVISKEENERIKKRIARIQQLEKQKKVFRA